jgi:Xanthine and CO dehydrogenases maturation factor, XdhC/CoxF family
MKSIFSALSELEATHQPAALCTVIKTSGSTPRHSTSKMLVYSNGEILGTVGGGNWKIGYGRKLLIPCKTDSRVSFHTT